MKMYPKSKDYISRMISKMFKEGKSREQSIAIALSMARERKHGKK